MRSAIITLSYTQLIDAAMPGPFEQALLKVSYHEFVLKSQNYNKEGKYTTFKEMAAADGRANSLHYKCAFPIGPYMELLKNEIPGLKDNAGNSTRFNSYEFKLVDSDITNHLAHRVSITYTTGQLYLIDNANDYLLLSATLPTCNKTAVSDTFLIKIVPGLSISSYEEMENFTTKTLSIPTATEKMNTM